MRGACCTRVARLEVDAVGPDNFGPCNGMDVGAKRVPIETEEQFHQCFFAPSLFGWYVAFCCPFLPWRLRRRCRHMARPDWWRFRRPRCSTMTNWPLLRAPLTTRRDTRSPTSFFQG